MNFPFPWGQNLLKEKKSLKLYVRVSLVNIPINVIIIHHRERKSAPTTCVLAPASMEQTASLIIPTLQLWQEATPPQDLVMADLFH